MDAFASPIPRGKTEAARRRNGECLGPPKPEYDDRERRNGVAETSYWLQRDPELGDSIVIVSESDQLDFAKILARPQSEFDRRHRAQILEIFGIDLAEPWGPRNALLGIWRAA